MDWRVGDVLDSAKATLGAPEAEAVTVYFPINPLATIGEDVATPELSEFAFDPPTNDTVAPVVGDVKATGTLATALPNTSRTLTCRAVGKDPLMTLD